MRNRRKILSVWLIAAALIITAVPVSAADAAAAVSTFMMEKDTLVQYRGTERSVTVPDGVKVIGKSAFEGNKNVELVVLPNSVERIEPYAFWGCDNLSTVVLGRSLTGVGDYAFAGCGGLKQMSIPTNVKYIGVQAFGNCENLTDISIPAQTTYIHESAFDRCARLTIHSDKDSTAETYAQAFYERQKEMPNYEAVPESAGSAAAPNPAESAAAQGTESAAPGSSAAPGTGSVAPGSSATPGTGSAVQGSSAAPGTGSAAPGSSATPGTGSAAPGSSAASGTDSAAPGTESAVPGSSAAQGTESAAPEPGTSVFSALRDVAELMGNLIAAGPVQSIPKHTVVDGRIVADQAFYRDDSLGEFSLQEGITEIGQFAFARSALQKIQIPNGVTDISYAAFYHCDGLMEVTLPDTVMNVEPKAFAYTGMMENFKNSDTSFLVSGGVLLAYNGSDSQVFVPGGIRVIAAEAFAGHEEIVSVKLPESVLVVGEAAFEGCSGLEQITFGANVEQIKDRAFADCGKLASVQLPSAVRETGLLAFGDAEVKYGGSAPEKTYEASATWLSNEGYRYAGQEPAQPGVTVAGVSPAEALLEDSIGGYTLEVEQRADSPEMEAAWKRVMQGEMPADMAVYDLRLTDGSGIPLTKLGRSGLSVILPLPETLSGRELKLVTLDRNGQLEALGVERVTLEDRECFRFRATHLSLFGIYSAKTPEDGAR